MDNKLKVLIQKEYQKCAIDPIHFLMKYCQIQHPVRGKVPFHLYEFQKKTIEELKEGHIKDLKARGYNELQKTDWYVWRKTEKDIKDTEILLEIIKKEFEY